MNEANTRKVAGMKKRTGWIAALCIVAAALLLLLCSQCSPLYPINTWVDANCLLTVGRVMREGGVIYRDIYEQKGPLLYLIHMIAACISDRSFLGVYVLEALSFAAVLLMACRLMQKKNAAGSGFAMLVGACLLVGASFAQGDSAEEFCLPYLMAALCIAFDQYGEKRGPMSLCALFVCGLLAGMVAMIKFTVLGLFVGLCAAEGVLALFHGGIVRALRSAGAFLAGMLLPIAPWFIYFAANGALSDFYTAYIYNNVFLYTDSARTFMDVLRDIYSMLRGNLLWVLLAGAGKMAFLLDREASVQLKGAVMAMGAGAFASVFLLGRTWTYSPLVLGVFALAWAPSAYAHVEKRLKSGAAHRAASLLCYALALCAAWASPNAYLRGMPLEETAQARLQKFIHPGATLLQYSHLDDGLYLLSGTLPAQRYFCRLNVNLPEMDEALDRQVSEAIPDYVLVSWRELPEQFDRYQLISYDAGYDDQGRINKPLYLYRRK